MSLGQSLLRKNSPSLNDLYTMLISDWMGQTNKLYAFLDAL